MKTLGNAARFYPPRTLGNGGQLNVAYKDLANTFSLAQTISLATSGVVLTLEDTANDAVAGITDHYRRRGTAAGQDGDDLWENQYNGLDDNASPAKTKYARTLAEIVDASDTTEDGRYSIGTMRAGTVVDWQIESGTLRYQGLTLPGTAGFINAAGYQLNNLALGQTLLQRTTLSTAALDTNSTGFIPFDDTKPQITEGKQLFSQAFTPLSASSKIKFTGVINLSADSTDNVTIALFNATTGNSAVQAATQVCSTDFMYQFPILYIEDSLNTTVRTYSLRYGGIIQDTYINGINAARRLGGSLITYLIIEEWL